MNENYYEKLKADFPTFGATLRLDERQQKSLQDLLSYTEGALSSYRSEIAIAKADTDHSSEFKAEKLKIAKTKSIGSIEAEFSKVQERLPRAQSVLHAATHQAAPKDSSEALLRHMQGREIREGLGKMPLSERVKFLQESCQDGHGDVLWAIENQPIISDLIPPDVMDRATETLGAKMAPEQSVLVEMAEQDFEGAEVVRNLAMVEMGHIENG